LEDSVDRAYQFRRLRRGVRDHLQRVRPGRCVPHPAFRPAPYRQELLAAGPIFEELAREFTIRPIASGDVTGLDVWSWWSTDGANEIDIVALAKKRITAIGTVKWRTAPLRRDVYAAGSSRRCRVRSPTHAGMTSKRSIETSF
jgi:hypothetical protein